MNELLKIADRVSMRRGKRTVIAIDGRCGAGKTTAAEKLAGILDAEIIHMDDFFLPAELRSDERLAQAGGNVHYERFLEEVVAGLKSGKEFRYRRFDCTVMDYTGEIIVKNKPVVIVEGTYSLHPLYGDIYNIKVFCDIDKKEQERRLTAREGFERYKQFRDKWIPMEETYFSTFRIPRVCDYILVNE
jgi:uridine kinase